MWNFEIAPPDENEIKSKVSELLVSEFESPKEVNLENEYAHYNHFNMYDHFGGAIEERPSTRTSSIRRETAGKKHVRPTGREGAFAILGDDSDTEYPIFRRPSKTDPGMTVATGVFDLDKGRWEILLDNPKCGVAWIAPLIC